MENNQVLVGIDFETANSSPLSACSVGLVVFLDGEVVFEYESLIKPPKEFSKFNYFNTTIHNIYENDVTYEKTWKEIYPILVPYLKNSLLVAHNARFDMRVLKALNEFYDIKQPDANYFCSVELSRQMLPYLSNHKLNTVSDFLEIELDHHNAKSDAVACAMIVQKCMIMSKQTNILQLLADIDVKPKNLNNE